MKAKTFILATTLGLFGLTAAHAVGSHAASRKAAEECTQFAQSRPACAVTFSQLSSNPEKYEDKVVSLVGFMAIDTFRLFLYPNKDAYEYSDNANSVYLEFSFDEANELTKTHPRHFVQVVGKFSSKDLGVRYGTRVGVIEPLERPVIRDIRPEDASTTTIDFEVDLSSE